jgi:hypothetical protein
MQHHGDRQRLAGRIVHDQAGVHAPGQEALEPFCRRTESWPRRQDEIRRRMVRGWPAEGEGLGPAAIQTGIRRTECGNC